MSSPLYQAGEHVVGVGGARLCDGSVEPTYHSLVDSGAIACTDCQLMLRDSQKADPATAERVADRVEVQAISLWEPWATLMALGIKTIETRSWPINHRGPLLICAAKRRVRRELFEVLGLPEFRRAFGCRSPDAVIETLNFGKAVALVEVYSCVKFAVTSSFEAGPELAFGDYSPGRYGWLTRGLKRLEPFPVTGSQGLFRVAVPERLLDGQRQGK